MLGGGAGGIFRFSSLFLDSDSVSSRILPPDPPGAGRGRLRPKGQGADDRGRPRDHAGGSQQVLLRREGKGSQVRKCTSATTAQPILVPLEPHQDNAINGNYLVMTNEVRNSGSFFTILTPALALGQPVTKSTLAILVGR